MSVRRATLDQAVSEGIITADQRDRLIALDEMPARTSDERAPAIMVAYATGAVAVLFAFGWFLIERWQRLGPGGVLVVVAVYALLFALTSEWLRRQRFPVAAAFAALLAVGMTPIATWAVLSMLGLWGGRSHAPLAGRLLGSDAGLPARWAIVELVTALAALLAYRRTRFAPLALPVALAAWLAPLHVAGAFHDGDIASTMWGWESLIMGSALLAAAHVVERRAYASRAVHATDGSRALAGDAAGFVYVVAIAAFLAAVAVLFDRSIVVRHGLIVLAATGAVLALRLGRRELLAASAVAFIAYLGYLAFDVFDRFVSFPVVLATFGIAIILLTVAAQRRWPALARRLAAGRAGEPRMPGGYAIPGALAAIALVMLLLAPPDARERLRQRTLENMRGVRKSQELRHAERGHGAAMRARRRGAGESAAAADSIAAARQPLSGETPPVRAP